jgi:phosphomannomutase
MGIFKAYDIRGIYPAELDEAMGRKIGQAFVKYLGEEYDGKLTVVIGKDMRLSSPSLSKAIIDGVTSMGADVIDIGLVSSPAFYYAVGKLGADGGLQISASHNPKEYNGIKVCRRNAYPVGLINGLDKIRDYAVAGDFEETEPGNVARHEGITKSYVDYCAQLYDFSGIKPHKVVVDVANAMGAPEMELLFKKLPGQLVKMYFDLDGTFPNHQADPMQPKNVEDLRKRVIEEKADLGIATDGDSDRIFFVDEKGNLVEPGIIRGILAEFVLRTNKGANIGYDIRPGRITRDMIVENGGKPFITKVGHSLIKLDAIRLNAPFSGESSGHFFFKNDYGIFELPPVVTQIILKELSEKGKTMSEMIKPLQRYFHSGEINTRVKDSAKVFQELEQKFGKGAENISKLDGILIEHKDYWFNVRASNTEPITRLNLEARTREKMEEMRDKVLEIIKAN